MHRYHEWHKLYEKPKPKPKHLSSRNSVAAQVQTTQNLQHPVQAHDSDIASLAKFQFSENQYKQLLHMLSHNCSAFETDMNPYSTVNSTQFASTLMPFASTVHNASYMTLSGLLIPVLLIMSPLTYTYYLILCVMSVTSISF